MMSNLLNMYQVYMQKHGSEPNSSFFEYQENDNNNVNLQDAEKTGKFGELPDSNREFNLLQHINEDELYSPEDSRLSGMKREL